MKSRIEEISPEVAKLILSQYNTDNRKESKAHVNFLAEQMADGQWREDAYDPIKFSVSGRLLDGQHRLSAVVQSGKTFKFLVIRDLSDDIFETLDTGKMRSAADVLKIAGIDNYVKMSALARAIINHRRGAMNSVIEGTGGNRSASTSNKEILSFVRENDLTEYVIFGRARYCDSRILNEKEWALLYYLFSAKSESEAEDFLVTLSKGVELKLGSPQHTLRQKLEQNMMSAGTRLNPRAKLFYIVRAWNAYRKGEEIKIFKYDPKGQFPEIV
jgi:hypothetical protein